MLVVDIWDFSAFLASHIFVVQMHHVRDSQRIPTLDVLGLAISPIPPRYHFEPTVYRAGFYSIKIYLQRPEGGEKKPGG